MMRFLCATMALLLMVGLVTGCRSASPKDASLTDDAAVQLPQPGREVVSTTPEQEPLWYTDFSAWRVESPRRRTGTYVIATGEGPSEALARRNAFDNGAASRGISMKDRSRLQLAGTPYVIAYDDGSYKVSAIYEFAQSAMSTEPDARTQAVAFQPGVSRLCDGLMAQLDDARLREIETLGVAPFGYKHTPFPCEFSDYLEGELRRALKDRLGDSAQVLDPALMKGDNALVTPDAALGGCYWSDMAERTVRIQARMTDMRAGTLLGETAITVKAPKGIRIEPMKAEAAEKNLHLLTALRQSIEPDSEGGKNFNIKVWLADGRRAWRKGERIVIHFRSERDCYLNLLHVNALGQVQLLFPNQWHQDAFIKAGSEYKIPSADMNFTFDIDEPFGTDLVLALATAVKTDGLYAFRSGQDEGFRAFPEGTRGIVVNSTQHIAGLPAEQKADALLTFTTMP